MQANDALKNNILSSRLSRWHHVDKEHHNKCRRCSHHYSLDLSPLQLWKCLDFISEYSGREAVGLFAEGSTRWWTCFPCGNTRFVLLLPSTNVLGLNFRRYSYEAIWESSESRRDLHQREPQFMTSLVTTFPWFQEKSCPCPLTRTNKSIITHFTVPFRCSY